MSRTNSRTRERKHLILILIAAVVALAFLLTRPDSANAIQEPTSVPLVETETVMQISGDEFESAVTTERLMILGMLGLVVLTWFYLKWRPPPDQEDEPNIDPDRE